LFFGACLHIGLCYRTLKITDVSVGWSVARVSVDWLIGPLSDHGHTQWTVTVAVNSMANEYCNV